MEKKSTFPKLLKVADVLLAKRENIKQQLKLETKFRLDDTLRALLIQPCTVLSVL